MGVMLLLLLCVNCCLECKKVDEKNEANQLQGGFVIIEYVVEYYKVADKNWVSCNHNVCRSQSFSQGLVNFVRTCGQ